MGNKKSTMGGLDHISDLTEKEAREFLHAVDQEQAKEEEEKQKQLNKSLSDDDIDGFPSDDDDFPEPPPDEENVAKKETPKKEEQPKESKEEMYARIMKENEELKKKQEELAKKLEVALEDRERISEEKEKIAKAFVSKASGFSQKIRDLVGEKEQLSSKLGKIQKDKLKSMKSRSKRAGILRQFYISEKQYVGKLDLLKQYYIDQIEQRGLLPDGCATLIFRGVLVLLKKNRDFVSELERVLFVGTTDDYLLDLFLRYMKNFEEYYGYINGFKAAFDELQAQYKKTKKLRKFNAAMASRMKKHGEKVATMVGLLLLPLQRLKRYKKVLVDLKELTNKKKIHFEQLQEALVLMDKHTKLRDSHSEHFTHVLRIVSLNVEYGLVLEPLDNNLLFFCEALRDHSKGKNKCKLFVLDKLLVCVERDEERGKKIVEAYPFTKNSKILDNHILLEVKIEFTKKEQKLEHGFYVCFHENKERYQKFVQKCRMVVKNLSKKKKQLT